MSSRRSDWEESVKVDGEEGRGGALGIMLAYYTCSLVVSLGVSRQQESTGGNGDKCCSQWQTSFTSAVSMKDPYNHALSTNPKRICPSQSFNL